MQIIGTAYRILESAYDGQRFLAFYAQIGIGLQGSVLVALWSCIFSAKAQGETLICVIAIKARSSWTLLTRHLHVLKAFSGSPFRNA